MQKTHVVYTNRFAKIDFFIEMCKFAMANVLQTSGKVPFHLKNHTDFFYNSFFCITFAA